MPKPSELPEAGPKEQAEARGETAPLLNKDTRLPLQGNLKDAETGSASCNETGVYQCLNWYFNLRTQFGGKLLALLFATQHILKGFVHHFAGQAVPYLYRSYHVPAPQMTMYSGITELPWALKPIIGLASDICPIFGYNKGPYMILTSILGMVAFCVIGIIPQSMLPIQLLVICLCVVHLQLSTCDLLSEAKYAERMQAVPEHGPALMTYVWFGLQAGGLVALMLSGFVIHYLGAKSAFAIAVLPASFVIYVVVNGNLEEEKQSHEQVARARSHFAKQKEACMLCVVIFLSSVALMTTSLVYADTRLNCIMAVIVFSVVLFCYSLVLSPVIAKFNAFALIQTSLSVSVGGASYFFFTDSMDQYLEGPHFSEFFYNSTLQSFGAIVSLVGIASYQRYFSNWSYRSLLVCTNIALSVFSLLDIVLFTRTNLRLGIPDHVFVLGSTAFQSIIATWQWMPQVVILSYLCPKGMEATMYALLAGCHNLGHSIAASWSAYMLTLLNVRPSGESNESAQFDNLAKASTVSVVLPMFTIILIFWLVPNKRQSETLIENTAYDATTGSLWQHLTSRAVDQDSVQETAGQA